MLEIRKAKMDDLDEIMKIYQRARKFMAEHGNPNQWGTQKPPKEQIIKDIVAEKSYICVEREDDIMETVLLEKFPEENNGKKEETIAAVFYYAIEEDSTYNVIYDGQWLNHKPYGVVHRIASAGIVKGAGEFCLKWAWQQCENLRIDTHEENIVMQTLLKKTGFQYCGIIHLKDGNPRLAFQKQ